LDAWNPEDPTLKDRHMRIGFVFLSLVAAAGMARADQELRSSTRTCTNHDAWTVSAQGSRRDPEEGRREARHGVELEQ
jgi:hypothetical protein